MKKTLCLFAIAIIASLTTKAQTPKEPVKARPTEHNEIRADQRLEKEIQQKQLSDKPVVLQEPAANQANKKVVHSKKMRKSARVKKRQ